MSDSIDTFCNKVLLRDEVLRFSERPIREPLLLSILEQANCAPSNYHLQPWHFILVQQPELKRVLSEVCLNSSKAASAAAVVVIAASLASWNFPYSRLLQESVSQRWMSTQEAQRNRQESRWFFLLGPLGIIGFLKRLYFPLSRWQHPRQRPITSSAELRSYMQQQAIFAATQLMVSAQNAGVQSGLVDAFDEDRLKRLLKMPSHLCVGAIVCLGYPIEGDELRKVAHFSLSEKLSREFFGRR